MVFINSNYLSIENEILYFDYNIFLHVKTRLKSIHLQSYKMLAYIKMVLFYFMFYIVP